MARPGAALLGVKGSDVSGGGDYTFREPAPCSAEEEARLSAENRATHNRSVAQQAKGSSRGRQQQHHAGSSSSSQAQRPAGYSSYSGSKGWSGMGRAPSSLDRGTGKGSGSGKGSHSRSRSGAGDYSQAEWERWYADGGRR